MNYKNFLNTIAVRIPVKIKYTFIQDALNNVHFRTVIGTFSKVIVIHLISCSITDATIFS